MSTDRMNVRSVSAGKSIGTWHVFNLHVSEESHFDHVGEEKVPLRFEVFGNMFTEVCLDWCSFSVSIGMCV